MADSDEHDSSVTSWIVQLKRGDHAAAGRLWERYFARLVGLARGKLLASRRRNAEADEEDAALSAFDSFCTAAAQGRFPRLNDRDDLWRLLVLITLRKVSDLFARDGRKKRGAGQVWNESALLGFVGSSENGLDALVGRDPTPEFAAMFAEEYERLLGALHDDAIRQIAIWRLEGYTRDEIAQRMDCSPRTVAYKLDFIRKTWLAQVSG
jgi:DNA-directed RNA polymerase specialized sigma24 family protein